MFGTDEKHVNLLIDDIVNSLDKLIFDEKWFLDNQNFQFKSLSLPRIKWVLHKVFNKDTFYSYQDCILMLYGAICPDCDLLTFKTKLTNGVSTIRTYIESPKSRLFVGKYVSYGFPIHTSDPDIDIPTNTTVKIIERNDEDIVTTLTVMSIDRPSLTGTLYLKDSGPVPEL